MFQSTKNILKQREKKKNVLIVIFHFIEILRLLLLKLSVQCIQLFLRTIFILSGKINERKVTKYIITQIFRNLGLKNAFDAFDETKTIIMNDNFEMLDDISL